MEFDLNNDADIAVILDEVYSPANQEYRREIDKQWRVLRGDLYHFVEEDLKKSFPKTYGSFTVSELNLASKITHKRSQAYKETPKRELVNEKETEIYHDVLWNCGAKWVWRDFDTYKNHFKYAAIWFSFYEDQGEQKIKLRALRPNQFSRVVDEQDRTKVFIVHLGNGGESSKNRIRGNGIKTNIQDQPEDNEVKDVAIWTDKQHVTIQLTKTKAGYQFTRKEIVGNELGVNPLGVIPAIFDQEGSEMELPAINPLSDQTITLNHLMSVLLTGSEVQTFGQMVISHPASQVLTDQIQQGLHTFIKLPQGENGEPSTRAEYISPSPDLSSMMEIYRLYAASILDEHGVKGGEAIKGSAQEFASGIDRLLSQMDTTEVIEANQESYAEKEQELYDIIKVFLVITGQANLTSPTVNVTYKKPRPMQSDKELLEIVEKKLALGLIEEWEKFLVFDPNLSIEEAKAKQEAIELEKKERMEMFLNANKQEGSNDESQSLDDSAGIQESEE